jgi:hypothetical protein
MLQGWVFMKWNQIKKRIETMLVDPVRERLAFGVTSYRKCHDQMGRGWITIDGKEILNMPSLDFDIEVYHRGRVGQVSYEEAEQEVHALNLFSQRDLHRSLYEYLSLSMDEILGSDNPIIRATGMLDSRMGKRRLLKVDVADEHDLVRRFYLLRCAVESIVPPSVKNEPVDLTHTLEKRWKTPIENGAGNSEEATTKLLRANKTRKIKTLISRIHSHELAPDDLVTEVARELFTGFEEAKNRDTLYHVLLQVEGQSKLLKTPNYVRGVVALSRECEKWKRLFEEWRPDSHNPDRQFSSLARHLWACYNVPLFMDNAWIHGNHTQQEWFRHIGAGKNIRTAANLPIPLTKMMAHHFQIAPASYSIDGAFRWAQVHGLGGDRRLADALLETRIAQDFRDNDFWLSVLRFFIRNPMLDPTHINPIIDYIWNRKYENRIVFVDAGVAEELGPEQPNFSMRGRTVDSLLTAVEVWHRQLGREAKSGNLQWKKSPREPFSFVEGSKQNKNMKVWRIRELLSSSELIAEGRAMQHCVASYSRSCHNGTCSIWTVDAETEEGMEKLLTLEVNYSDNLIRQVRGKRNRRPTEKEKEVVQRWATRVGLQLASYI